MNAANTQTQMTSANDARLLLSFGQLERTLPRSIHILDVGCSTAESLIAQAELQADVLFCGIESNNSALTEARKSVRALGLENIELELVDFAMESGIENAIDVPEGGFDIIQVSSLPQGTSSLSAFLGTLQGLLSDHGVISLNLPGRKQHMNKVAEAIDGACARNLPLAERIDAAREIVDRMVGEEPSDVDWRRASLVGDADFVDRYMQSETSSCDVNEVFLAIADQGMTFLRWHELAEWNFETLELGREELDRVRSLPMPEQFRMVEAQRNPAMLSLAIGKGCNSPRGRFDLTKAGETHFMVHPDTTFTIDSRNVWGATQYDRLSVKRGSSEAVEVRPSPAQTALFALRDQREPFSGLNLVEVMTAEGASLEEALLALHQLVGMDLIYRPQEFDVAQFYAAMMAERSPEATSDMVVTPSVPQRNNFVPAAGEPAAPLPKEEPATAPEKA